jgi:hypothetical protein
MWKISMTAFWGFIIMVVIGIYLQRKQWENYPMGTIQSELKGDILKLGLTEVL